LHIPGRGFGPALSMAGTFILLKGLYLWRRNIFPSLIAHFLRDTVFFFLIAHAAWLMNWVVLPEPGLALAGAALVYLFLRKCLFRRMHPSTSG